MRIFYRLDRRKIWVGLLLCVVGVASARGQVLAQRNWAGSGVSMEPWWQRAVFYRIDPERFQDSTGSGRGDLGGVAQRLRYLQGLGVDALIVRVGSGAKAAARMEGFDDLARAAVDSHVRVLAEMGAPASQGADAQYLETARAWLNQGVSGLVVPTAALEKVDGTEHIAELLRQLRALTDSFPGGRVLVADAPAAQDQGLLLALGKSAQLTASEPLAVQPGTAVAGAASGLRVQLMTAESAGKDRPMLQAARVAEAADAQAEVGMKRAVAVMLLASRGAVLLEYGQELGLDAAVKGGAPLMQWTPTNLTRKPVPPHPAVAAKTRTQPKSMAFHAYIPPLRKDLFPPPPMPYVTESDDPVAEVVDPAALPGFTAGNFDAGLEAGNGATANVAMEQADAGSLLHLYEQLIELHHENATLRNGAQVMLNYDAQGALVWVRRAPANSRTLSSVVVGCNLSGKPVALEDVDGVGMRGMRSLLSPRPMGDLGVMAGDAVVVAAVR